jgi:general secretion pathway protein H
MRARQDGFTLVELLAVLVVLAIVAGVATTNLGARHSGDVLQATAHELASRCRAARSAAIRQATDQTVVIDMGNRVIIAGKDVPPLRIVDAVSIASETSATEQRAPRVAGIRFFPNGGSTGGKIRLETGRQAYEVRVNWLTGRVAVERML